MLISGALLIGLGPPVPSHAGARADRAPPCVWQTIPVILDGKDVVAMARTGSGKTACFLLPMFERLKARSAQTGARALILSPTRELALQTMKFTKEVCVAGLVGGCEEARPLALAGS